MEPAPEAPASRRSDTKILLVAVALPLRPLLPVRSPLTPALMPALVLAPAWVTALIDDVREVPAIEGAADLPLTTTSSPKADAAFASLRMVYSRTKHACKVNRLKLNQGRQN